MRFLSIFAALSVLAVPLHGQKPGGPKGPHYTLNIVAAAYDSSEADEGVVYVKKTGATEIQVSLGSDSALTVTDADGTDGQAAVSLPSGDFTAWATAGGKPGGSATLNGQTFSRAKKKKSQAQQLTEAAAGSWTYDNSGLQVLQVRFYPSAAPSPAPADSGAAADSAK